jgi:hypothetical protein
VLHLYFKVSVQDALLLVSPLGVATLSQAHVDAAAAKAKVPAGADTGTPPAPPDTAVAIEAVPTKTDT